MSFRKVMGYALFFISLLPASTVSASGRGQANTNWNERRGRGSDDRDWDERREMEEARRMYDRQRCLEEYDAVPMPSRRGHNAGASGRPRNRRAARAQQQVPAPQVDPAAVLGVSEAELAHLRELQAEFQREPGQLPLPAQDEPVPQRQPVEGEPIRPALPVQDEPVRPAPAIQPALGQSMAQSMVQGQDPDSRYIPEDPDENPES